MATSTSMGPLPDNWLAACIADLTPDLHIFISLGLIAESFHSLQSLSVSCFHVILGLLGPRFPSTCMWKAVLTAPLEHSTCPHKWSPLSFRMRSRSSMPSPASSSLDLVVTYLAAWHCRSVWSLPCHFAADAGGLWKLILVLCLSWNWLNYCWWECIQVTLKSPLDRSWY